MNRHCLISVFLPAYLLIQGSFESVLAQTPSPLTSDEVRAGVISEKLPAVSYTDVAWQQSIPHERRILLDETFAKVFIASKATGLSACVYSPNQGPWTGTLGVQDREAKAAIGADSRFHAGSIGKLVTSVLIQQLIEEGRFTRDTKLSHWLPEIKGSDKITIEHLLSHTSGLPGNLVEENPTKHEPLLQRVVESAQAGLQFPPGRSFSYSNPGYMALGLILEKEHGKPLAEIIDTQFIKKYGMAQSKGITRENRNDDLIHSTHQGRPGKDAIDYSSVGGTGSLASTPYDLARMLNRLLAGQMLKQETTQRMLSKMYPMQKQGQLYWGQGLMVLDTPLGRMFYLAGRIKGFGAMAGYLPQEDVFVSVMVNDDTQVEPVMFALLKALQPRKQDKRLISDRRDIRRVA
ncbi:MAG TPA: serine hydrolase domain-containing protein [Gemmatales bacterium]|nr:serine hydrolase domain-containing protein [Gemmatales bacterium]